MILEELDRIWKWEERHRRLSSRLMLVVAGTLALDAVFTVAMYMVESDVKGSDIHSPYQAWFWVTTQLLTVSSQMRNPVTNIGRALDVVLELWAVVVVAGSAGAFASFFQTADRKTSDM